MFFFIGVSMFVCVLIQIIRYVCVCVDTRYTPPSTLLLSTTLTPAFKSSTIRQSPYRIITNTKESSPLSLFLSLHPNGFNVKKSSLVFVSTVSLITKPVKDGAFKRIRVPSYRKGNRLKDLRRRRRRRKGIIGV